MLDADNGNDRSCKVSNEKIEKHPGLGQRLQQMLYTDEEPGPSCKRCTESQN